MISQSFIVTLLLIAVAGTVTFGKRLPGFLSILYIIVIPPGVRTIGVHVELTSPTGSIANDVHLISSVRFSAALAHYL
jgi:hypothetical protein